MKSLFLLAASLAVGHGHFLVTNPGPGTHWQVGNRAKVQWSVLQQQHSQQPPVQHINVHLVDAQTNQVLAVIARELHPWTQSVEWIVPQNLAAIDDPVVRVEGVTGQGQTIHRYSHRFFVDHSVGAQEGQASQEVKMVQNMQNSNAQQSGQLQKDANMAGQVQAIQQPGELQRAAGVQRIAQVAAPPSAVQAAAVNLNSEAKKPEPAPVVKPAQLAQGPRVNRNDGDGNEGKVKAQQNTATTGSLTSAITITDTVTSSNTSSSSSSGNSNAAASTNPNTSTNGAVLMALALALVLAIIL